MHLNRFLRILILLIFLAPSLIAGAYNISGIVVDADSGDDTLIAATIRLLSARDSAQVAVTTTNEAGKFTFKGINNGKYVLQASYVGMETLHQPVAVQGKNVSLGTVKMHAQGLVLKEAVVEGVRTRMKVMTDTIEFNAQAYKTQPNAVVEDLLKRLPGVEVSSDGKITANGKEVSKILVDGKEFFSDDPTVASRNLPVEMVDKLQVVDRKSDLARLTGVDDGEEETVINLTVKKDMQNGWFGNAEAGYGTDDRYMGSFTVNRFQNGNQFTLLGSANNINQLGFTDGTAGRFQRFGGSNGITSSQSLGLNFNVGRGDELRFGGDIMYSHSDRDTRTRSDREYLFPDSTSYVHSNKTARDRGQNLNADFRLKWDIDSANTIDFRPNFSWNYNRSTSADSSLTRAGDPQRSMVTQSLNLDSSRGTSVQAGGRLIYNHKFLSHPGRSLSLFVNYNFSNTREKSDSYSWNKFYLLNDSVDLYDQYQDNRTWSNNISARLTWTEPLGNVKNGNFITVAYRFSYRWNNSDRMIYDYPVSWPDGWDADPLIGNELVWNEDLSNQFRNHYMTQDIRVGYKHVGKKTNLEVGASLNPQMMESFNLINVDKNIPRRTTWNYAPYLRYRYRMGKQRSFQINYRSYGSQPSMTQLQPVADVTDPLRIVVGNPDLKPKFTHSVRLRFQDFNADAQRSIMLMADGEIAQNSIISRTEYNSTTGGQVTTYENVNGVWNLRLMNLVSMPMPFYKQLTITNHLMGSFSRSIGYNNSLRNAAMTYNVNEMLGIAWRPDNIELEIRPYYRLQFINNSLDAVADRTVHSWGGQFNGVYYTPIGIVLNTDLTYAASSGYSAGYDTKQWLWNASISYQFLRNKSATVTLKGYDLLQQKSNIRRNVTANYISDEMYNSLTRYFMVTVAYRFTTFGKGKNPKTRDQQEWEQRMGGHPGPPPGGMGGGRPPRPM